MTCLKRLRERDRMVSVIARDNAVSNELVTVKALLDSMMFDIKGGNDFKRDPELDAWSEQIGESYLALVGAVRKINRYARRRLDELEEAELS